MKKAFWIVNKVDSKTAEIYLYGYIGYYDGVTAAAFVKELKELEKSHKNINIRINSGGGQVYDGFAIFNAIRNSKANIDAYIDGMAASMGGVVAVACRKVYMSRVAQFMSHKVTGGCWGNADEMERTAKVLNQLEDSICQIFAERTGLTTEECHEKYMANGDRWLSAQEALDEKLIDGIYDATEVSAPENVTDAEQMWEAYHTQLDPILNQIINHQNSNSDMKKITLPINEAMLQLLGATNADDNAIIAAVNTAIENAAKVPQLEQKVNTLTAEKEDLQGQLDALTTETTETILDGAVDEGLMTVEAKAVYAEQFANNIAGLKKVVATLKPTGSIIKKLNTGGEGASNKSDLIKKFDELDANGEIENVAKNDWANYEAMYEAKFNKKPNKI